LEAHVKLKRICEVLVSTVIVAVMTVTIFVTIFGAYSMLRNGPAPIEPGKLVLAFLFAIFVGLGSMGVYIFPSAFFVSLVMAILKGWSVRAVAALLLAVVICGSISAYLIDPTQSESSHGADGYFARFEWFASQFNLIAVITGFGSSLIAFWAVLRYRRRYEARHSRP
jgi:hypothetical protein